MSHAFKIIPAKPTFGKFKENISYSDYINIKKGIYCKHSFLPLNKSNLIAGQYTSLDLKNICTISEINPMIQPSPCSSSLPCEPCQNNNPVIIQPNTSTIPFYYNYQIDPLGELFGKTQCGELNYKNYMKVAILPIKK